MLCCTCIQTVFAKLLYFLDLRVRIFPLVKISNAIIFGSGIGTTDTLGSTFAADFHVIVSIKKKLISTGTSRIVG